MLECLRARCAFEVAVAPAPPLPPLPRLLAACRPQRGDRQHVSVKLMYLAIL